MLFPEYEKVVQFASDGKFEQEITLARQEFVERTGDLFESDESYDQRVRVFLEWYVLDRTVSIGIKRTPVKLYIESVTAGRTTQDLAHLRQLTKTELSIFEFKKAKEDQMRVVDVLTNEKHNVFERRKPAGIEPGDLFEGRLVRSDNRLMMSRAVIIHPRLAKKAILKAAKNFRKAPAGKTRHDVVHRVAYFTNRSERYSHLPTSQIFEELN